MLTLTLPLLFLQELFYENRYYHSHCFRCFRCDRSLADEPFTSQGDALVCSGCYCNEFSSKCAACDKIVMPGSDSKVWLYLFLPQHQVHKPLGHRFLSNHLSRRFTPCLCKDKEANKILLSGVWQLRCDRMIVSLLCWKYFPAGFSALGAVTTQVQQWCRMTENYPGLWVVWDIITHQNWAVIFFSFCSAWNAFKSCCPLLPRLSSKRSEVQVQNTVMPLGCISGPNSRKTRPVIKGSDVHFHKYNWLLAFITFKWSMCFWANAYVYVSGQTATSNGWNCQINKKHGLGCCAVVYDSCFVTACQIVLMRGKLM